jgi:hypothetical protein
MNGEQSKANRMTRMAAPQKKFAQALNNHEKVMVHEYD